MLTDPALPLLLQVGRLYGKPLRRGIVSVHCLRAFLLRWEVTFALQVRDQSGDVKKLVRGYYCDSLKGGWDSRPAVSPPIGQEATDSHWDSM